MLSFDDEAEMLEAWTKFVNEVDPDVIIGYNIANFDLPYLIDRANAIKATGFPFLGRIQSMSVSLLLVHKLTETSQRTSLP